VGVGVEGGGDGDGLSATVGAAWSTVALDGAAGGREQVQDTTVSSRSALAAQIKRDAPEGDLRR
jgi:hypothetical protein